MTVDRFCLLLKAHGLPLPEVEVVFAPPRRFRADYCWPAQKVIVEREGGLWSRHINARRAHAQPLNIQRDMEKANVAQALGYRYLRFTPEQLERGDALAYLRPLLQETADHDETSRTA